MSRRRGRPRLAKGRTRDVAIRLGQDEVRTLEHVADGGTLQSAIRVLIAREKSRQR